VGRKLIAQDKEMEEVGLIREEEIVAKRLRDNKIREKKRSFGDITSSTPTPHPLMIFHGGTVDKDCTVTASARGGGQ